MTLPAGISGLTANTTAASTSSSNLTGVQAGNMASSAISTAAKFYTSYQNAKHSAKMTEMNWEFNKASANVNLKLNQYITSRNKLEMLDATSAEKLSIATQEMQAKAAVEVNQATLGIKGGSAQQVLHSISREAEKAESSRLYNLDAALFSNKLQAFQAESAAASTVGIRPVGGVSGSLAVGSALTQIGSNLNNIVSGG